MKISKKKVEDIKSISWFRNCAIVSWNNWICFFFFFYFRQTFARFYCVRFILLWIIAIQSGIHVSFRTTSTINHQKNGPLFFVLFSRRMMFASWFFLFCFFFLCYTEALKKRKEKSDIRRVLFFYNPIKIIFKLTHKYKINKYEKPTLS